MNIQKDFVAAIQSADLDKINDLLAQGADVNEIDPDRGEPLICTAITNGETDVVLRLLQERPDLSLPPLPEPRSHAAIEKIEDEPPTLVTWRWLTINVFIRVGIHMFGSPAFERLSARSPVAFHLRNLTNGATPLGFDLVTSLVSQIFPRYTRQRSLSLKQRTMSIWHKNRDNIILYGMSRLTHGRIQAMSVFLLSWKGYMLREFLHPIAQRISHRMSYRITAALASEYKTQDQPIISPIYPGEKITQAILESDFCSEELFLEVLNQELLSPEYIAHSVDLATSSTSQHLLLVAFWTAALKLNYVTVVVKLITLGVPVDLITQTNVTGLALASSIGSLQLVELLLEKGASVNVPVSITIHNSLHWEAEQQPLIASLLARAHEFNRKGAVRDELEKALIEHGADVNAKDITGTPALLLTISQFRTNTTELLLHHGADLNAQDREGQNACHYASNFILEDKVHTQELLVRAGVPFDIPDKSGATPLMCAVRHGHDDSALFLISEGADPLVKTSAGKTTLQEAAGYCSIKTFEALLKAGVDVNSRDNASDTALLVVSMRRFDREPGLKFLLKAGADPNVRSSRKWPGRTALIRACREDCADIKGEDDTDSELNCVRELIKYGADVNGGVGSDTMQEGGEETPVGAAVSRGKRHILAFLLEQGADPNGHNDSGLPALLAACGKNWRATSKQEDYEDDVALLLDYGANSYARDQEGRCCIHHAVANFRAAQTCISRFKDRNFIDTKDKHGLTGLHEACANNNWMTQETYLNWTGHNGPVYGNWHMSQSSKCLLRILRAGGANPLEKNSQGLTPLHIAARVGNPRITASLLLWTRNTRLFELEDDRGRLPLHYAVRSFDVTKVLLHYYRSDTVLEDDYFEVLEDPIASLLKTRDPFYDELEGPAINFSTYLAESRKFEIEAAAMSLRRSGFINTGDKYGNTPLHYAVLAGNAQVVKLFLEILDIDVGAVNKAGESILDYAMGHRDCEAMIRNAAPHLRPTNFSTFVWTTEALRKRDSIRNEAIRFVERLTGYCEWPMYDDE